MVRRECNLGCSFRKVSELANWGDVLDRMVGQDSDDLGPKHFYALYVVYL